MPISIFTKQDAKDLEMPLKMLRLWEYYMNELWGELKATYICQSENNCIYIGAIEIAIQFVNRSYLMLQVSDLDDTQIATYRIKDKDALMAVVFAVLKSEI